MTGTIIITTERDRITANIAACRSNAEYHQRKVETANNLAREYEEKLAALPPDKLDLSAWRPKGGERYFYIDIDGMVVESTYGHSYEIIDGDCNFYQDRRSAVAASNRRLRHDRLWQCYERLYGTLGWKPDENNAGYVIKTNHLGMPRSFPPDHLHQTGLPVFQTREHCDWVIDQLQSEKVLYSGNKLQEGLT